MRSSGSVKSNKSVRIGSCGALETHIATFGAAINVNPEAASCAVIQVKPGIGDVIWHLPFIRAIATAAPGGCVSFLAPPTSCAKELLAAEPGVAQTLYFEHGGSELRRGFNLIRLVALLRRNRFASIWILDRTIRPALAAMLAGIPERIGLGLGPQSFFITNPGIGQDHFHDQPIDWLRALMAAMNVPLPSTEPDLRLPDAVLAATAEKFKSCARPWIVLGIGASHPDKDWPDDALGGIFVGCCGAHQRDGFPDWRAHELRAGAKIHDAKSAALRPSMPAISALVEAAALLRRADLFIGTELRPNESRAPPARPKLSACSARRRS